MILQVIAAYFVTVTFSIMFHSAKNQLLIGGFVGALGWWVYLMAVDLKTSIVIASFLGALVASMLSLFLCRLRKAPITVFQIPGIIPLVPGMGMYKTLSAAISGDDQLVFPYLFETLQIAGAIAIAMLLVHTFRNLFFMYDSQKAHR